MTPVVLSSPGVERVELPYGLWRSGEVVRALPVRPLSGADELAVEEALAGGTTAIRAGNLLLGRCLVGAATDGQPIAAETAAALAIGDREVVLRAIYARNIAPRVTATDTCDPPCGEAIEFDLDMTFAPEMPPEPGPTHHLRLAGRRIACRVPTGGDLEAAAEDPENPVAALARACVSEAAIPRDELASALARLDPNAETVINLACPACGRERRLYLDAFELLRRAFQGGGGILGQVHRLASAYGWSERDILTLPRARRLRYCALAAEEALQ